MDAISKSRDQAYLYFFVPNCDRLKAFFLVYTGGNGTNLSLHASIPIPLVVTLMKIEGFRCITKKSQQNCIQRSNNIVKLACLKNIRLKMNHNML